MPLVLSASSVCDVCLEGYTCETPEDCPHAISCGHIFCLRCLLSIGPPGSPTCPLCRKRYAMNAVKKLHVDPPSALDPEVDFLRRVAFAFDGQQHERESLVRRIEPWLEENSETDHSALRHALNALNLLSALKDRTQEDGVRVNELEGELGNLRQINADERDRFDGLESGYLARIQELDNEVLELKGLIKPLRKQLKQFKHSSANPLPAPPEPVPLDRFPSFARPVAESAEGFASYFTPGTGAPTLFPEMRSEKSRGKRRATEQHAMPSTGSIFLAGAPPSQRVIPPGPESGTMYNDEAPAAAYVSGYSNGYSQGLSYGNGGQPEPIYPPPSSVGPRYNSPLEDSISALRLSAPIASAAIAMPNPPPASSDPIPLTRWIANCLIYAPAVSSRETSTEVPPRAMVSPPTAHQVAARRMAHQRDSSHRQSLSSWGTVHSDPNSPAASNHSMGGLGLRNFPLSGFASVAPVSPGDIPVRADGLLGFTSATPVSHTPTAVSTPTQRPVTYLSPHGPLTRLDSTLEMRQQSRLVSMLPHLGLSSRTICGHGSNMMSR
ncbi:unnamed protein product [Mycena citricolor]|uniref:RING-type domain-containing protein n=1 Tax=Mycena citricolor TaxID=2018698 RepID=A0AAD2HSF8_9AGAR|nr:unnamed protein product [Mycena citricolor]